MKLTSNSGLIERRKEMDEKIFEDIMSDIIVVSAEGSEPNI